MQDDDASVTCQRKGCGHPLSDHYFAEFRGRNVQLCKQCAGGGKSTECSLTGMKRRLARREGPP